MKFYKCDICGNFVEKIKDSGVDMICCGQKMTEQIPGTSDGAADKHVPVYSVDGKKITVNVGSVNHPMAEVHYIEWIAVETDKSEYRTALKPGNPPMAEFTMAEGESVIAVYAYCNLHGLWKS